MFLSPRQALITPCFMKVFYFVAVSWWCLAGCQKEDATAPLIEAAFHQRVTLYYQQRVALPTQNVSELTVTIDDVEDTRCPQGLRCQLAGEVYTHLAVRDQSGASQSVTLQLVGHSTSIDSAAVQANGRQYTLVLQEVTPYPETMKEPKQQKRVTLLVKRQ
jgi:hypothetical protein